MGGRSAPRGPFAVNTNANATRGPGTTVSSSMPTGLWPPRHHRWSRRSPGSPPWWVRVELVWGGSGGRSDLPHQGRGRLRRVALPKTTQTDRWRHIQAICRGTIPITHPYRRLHQRLVLATATSKVVGPWANRSSMCCTGCRRHPKPVPVRRAGQSGVHLDVRSPFHSLLFPYAAAARFRLEGSCFTAAGFALLRRDIPRIGNCHPVSAHGRIFAPERPTKASRHVPRRAPSARALWGVRLNRSSRQKPGGQDATPGPCPRTGSNHPAGRRLAIATGWPGAVHRSDFTGSCVRPPLGAPLVAAHRSAALR